MATITKTILKQGESGQTVDQADAAICSLVGIPCAGTSSFFEKSLHADGYEYTDVVNSLGWGGFTKDQIMSVITLEEVTVQFEIGDD